MPFAAPFRYMPPLNRRSRQGAARFIRGVPVSPLTTPFRCGVRAWLTLVDALKQSRKHTSWHSLLQKYVRTCLTTAYIRYTMGVTDDSELQAQGPQAAV